MTEGIAFLITITIHSACKARSTSLENTDNIRQELFGYQFIMSGTTSYTFIDGQEQLNNLLSTRLINFGQLAGNDDEQTNGATSNSKTQLQNSLPGNN